MVHQLSRLSARSDADDHQPGEDRVRRDDRRNLAEELTAEPFGFRGEAAPLRVAQSEPNSVLFEQILDDSLLSAVHEAGGGEQQHLQRVDLGQRTSF